MKTQAEKRAHHNALERKRRDHIKDSFTSLRDSVPTLQGEKVVSLILLFWFKCHFFCFLFMFRSIFEMIFRYAACFQAGK